MYVCMYVCISYILGTSALPGIYARCPIYISYSTVVLYSGDRYEIIGLLKISDSIKQPCSSGCLKKSLEMHQKCSNNAVPLLNKTKNRIF